MWQLTSSLQGKCVYKTQRIIFMETIRCSVNEIYKNGKKKFSGYVGANTKTVFRSESSRILFFIQMSSEMWHFEETGEIMFDKMINSLFPEILKRWKELDVHHLITIVLFTSIKLNNDNGTLLDHGERPKLTRDYYRVVVDQVHITRWDEIMSALRYEFNIFVKNVLLEFYQEKSDSNVTILPSVKGNILEAINLGTSLITNDNNGVFRELDLRHTNNHFIIISPGTGLFDVDYNLLRYTSKKMLSLESVFDIVCLSRPPLHVVPLFRYKDSKQSISHSIPNWIDISFWNNVDKMDNQWIPRCKIYEIQMMDLMENEMSEISIDNIFFMSSNGKEPKTIEDAVDDYDADVFKPARSLNEMYGTELVNRKYTRHNFFSSEAIRFQGKSRGSGSYHKSSILKYGPQPYSPGILSITKVDPSTTTSQVFGEVNNTRPNISALSSLLSLQTPSLTNHKDLQKTNKDNDGSTVDSGASTKSVPVPRVKNTTSYASDHSTTIKISKANRLAHSKSMGIINSSPFDGKLSNNLGSQFRNNVNMVISETKRSPSKFFHEPINRKTSFSSHQIANDVKRSIGSGSSPLTKDSLQVQSDTISSMLTFIENPSQPVMEYLLAIYNQGRWKHAFPPNIKRTTIKWQSLSTPASLPITTLTFPSVADFELNYTFQIYDVILDSDKAEEITTRDLLCELVELRLVMGFQICVDLNVRKVEGRRKPDGNPKALVTFIPEEYHGCRLYMLKGEQIHRISCDYYGNVNVQVYKNSKKDQFEVSNNNSKEASYFPYMKTRFDETYRQTKYDVYKKNEDEFNWNQMDQVLGGYDDAMVDKSQENRARFIILPTGTLPKQTKWGVIPEEKHEKLNIEETNLEGIRYLISLIYKNRHLTKEGKRRNIDPNNELVPTINFYTGDLTTFVTQHVDENERYGSKRKESLFVRSGERFNRNIKLTQLAHELQCSKGIKFVDRRWHWKVHRHCFLGMELVTWLIEYFTDIDKREDAVIFGNELMKEGLFRHVENRHAFLDGHYFYQLNTEYVTILRSNWFTNKKDLHTHGSNSGLPSTPIPSDEKPSLSSFTSTSDLSIMRNESTTTLSTLSTLTKLTNSATDTLRASSAMHSKKRVLTPTEISPEVKPIAEISGMILLDVDPQKFSRRPEVVEVHYDRVHNPEHGYHIRLEWVNTTSKFIENTITNWSRVCDRYGLKLIKVPWNELSQLMIRNPFHSQITTKLTIDPSTFDLLVEDDLSSSISSLKSLSKDPINKDPFFYHKYILAKSGFVVESTPAETIFSSPVRLVYTWGIPDYQYFQYIHRSGTAIAELTKDGVFIVGPNNSHLSRLGTSASPYSIEKTELTFQEIIYNFRDLCNDTEALKILFLEAKKNWEINYYSTHKNDILDINLSHSLESLNNPTAIQKKIQNDTTARIFQQMSLF